MVDYKSAITFSCTCMYLVLFDGGLLHTPTTGYEQTSTCEPFCPAMSKVRNSSASMLQYGIVSSHGTFSLREQKDTIVGGFVTKSFSNLLTTTINSKIYHQNYTNVLVQSYILHNEKYMY